MMLRLVKSCLLFLTVVYYEGVLNVCALIQAKVPCCDNKLGVSLFFVA